MPADSALPASTRPSGAGSTESSRPSAGLAIPLAPAGARRDGHGPARAAGARLDRLPRVVGGGALALAPASYGLYMNTELAITGDLARYDSNSQRWLAIRTRSASVRPRGRSPGCRVSGSIGGG